MKFSIEKFVQERIKERENEEEQRKIVKSFVPSGRKKKKENKIKIDKKVLRALAGLSKKKVINKQILKNRKKAVLVIHKPRTIEKAKSMFFNQVGRGV